MGYSLCPCLLLNVTPSLVLGAEQSPGITRALTVRPLGALTEEVLSCLAVTPAPAQALQPPPCSLVRCCFSAVVLPKGQWLCFPFP